MLTVALGCSGGTTRDDRARPRPESGSEAESGVGSACLDVGTDSQYSQRVRGEHRRCEHDADCLNVPLDCSNVHCTGVTAPFASSYRDQFECAGYPGPVADYDCRARYGSEVPRCEAGCCISRRR